MFIGPGCVKPETFPSSYSACSACSLIGWSLRVKHTEKKQTDKSPALIHHHTWATIHVCEASGGYLWGLFNIVFLCLTWVKVIYSPTSPQAYQEIYLFIFFFGKLERFVLLRISGWLECANQALLHLWLYFKDNFTTGCFQQPKQCESDQIKYIQ